MAKLRQKLKWLVFFWDTVYKQLCTLNVAALLAKVSGWKMMI